MSESQTPVSDLYVRIGRLEKQLEQAQREAVYLRDVIASKDLDMATLRASLRLRDIKNSLQAETLAQLRMGHRADCPSCPLCVTYTPSPVATREDLDTATDGRTLR